MAMGRIHSWESMGLVDGPGIRTVIFLQGCRLRCRYCHNPDTWELCGGGTLESPEETVNRLMRFKPYYGADGGVTFSGGEPLLQKEFLTEVLALCKSRGIHTCLDTAGVGCGGYGEILKNTDLVLLDVKHYTPEGPWMPMRNFWTRSSPWRFPCGSAMWWFPALQTERTIWRVWQSM